MKKRFCIILSAIIVISALASCAAKPEQETTKPTETTTTTTTETTTVTTTEDENTTFPETSTRKIHKGLSKDKNGEYPYKIATYTTHYNSGDTTRTTNLKNAVSKVNNIVVPDGQVFSFNQTVGKRTVTAGYETAKIVRDGEFVDGLGGGVCQVSSTIFETVLRANAEIVVRHPHTLKVSYVPLGGDATVQWNTQDFQWKNTIGCDVKIKMHCESGSLTCSIYAKNDVDVGDVKINITSSGGSYVLTRTVNGKQNYRTVSKYKEQKSTTKATTKKSSKKTTKKTTKKKSTKKKKS
ncbi:MAG: VanW family protein [Eubacterium sp.]|nr:VanW family protein [Eubacterium sp.]